MKILKGMRCCCDLNFKTKAVNYAEKTNICRVGKKYRVAEVNLNQWRQFIGKFKTVKFTHTLFSSPKKGSFSEIDKCA